MAEINRLSVGKALDQLRKPDAPAHGLQETDTKIEQARAELRRLQAMRKSIAAGKPPTENR